MPKSPKRKYVNFKPVFAVKIAKDLKEGKSRAQIIREMSQRFGISKAHIEKILYSYFPAKAIAELKKDPNFAKLVEGMLWDFRYSTKSSEDRHKISLRAAASLTPEQRSERALKGSASLTPEQRRARALVGLKAISSQTSEQRSKIALKREASLTPAQKSTRSLKGFETRKINVSYVSDLPKLNLLSKKETVDFLKKYFDLVFDKYCVNKKAELKILPLRFFTKRADFQDISSEFQMAILEALQKWDKERDLDTLVSDSIIWNLYNYFLREKKYSDLLISDTSVDVAEQIVERSKSGRQYQKQNRDYQVFNQ